MSVNCKTDNIHSNIPLLLSAEPYFHLVTGAETMRPGQGQKAGQVPDNLSKKECWRVVHEKLAENERGGAG